MAVRFFRRNYKEVPECYKGRAYPYEEWIFDMYWDAYCAAEREWRAENESEEENDDE